MDHNGEDFTPLTDRLTYLFGYSVVSWSSLSRRQGCDWTRERLRTTRNPRSNGVGSPENVCVTDSRGSTDFASTAHPSATKMFPKIPVTRRPWCRSWRVLKTTGLRSWCFLWPRSYDHILEESLFRVLGTRYNFVPSSFVEEKWSCKLFGRLIHYF